MTLNTFSATIEGKCDLHDVSRRNASPPHMPTKRKNKHRPALPAITRDWLLKHHSTVHASAGLDSCVDITSRDRRYPAASVSRTYIG
ncbi:hypothetical protein TNCV_4388981 [Trichonephila clavipes]|nr:hypothetical protein TNCV_4388981 [Trichonephila clavipes]